MAWTERSDTAITWTSRSDTSLSWDKNYLLEGVLLCGETSVYCGDSNYLCGGQVRWTETTYT